LTDEAMSHITQIDRQRVGHPGNRTSCHFYTLIVILVLTSHNIFNLFQDNLFCGAW